MFERSIRSPAQAQLLLGMAFALAVLRVYNAPVSACAEVLNQSAGNGGLPREAGALSRRAWWALCRGVTGPEEGHDAQLGSTLKSQSAPLGTVLVLNTSSCL